MEKKKLMKKKKLMEKKEKCTFVLACFCSSVFLFLLQKLLDAHFIFYRKVGSPIWVHVTI